MVCPKLDSGACKTTGKICDKTYAIKMINFKDCPVFKKSPVVKKPKGKVKTSVKKSKKRKK